MFNYKPYIKSLLNYMQRNGYTIKPFPKVVLNDKQQDEPLFIQTGYYEPESKTVVIFTKDRHPKDVLRSLAHEMIHHKQNMEGRLSNGAYSGDKITEDEKLLPLESEAYKDGNLAFRSWTEWFRK